MGIVFEQPGAFSAAASVGGGAADQFSRDFPSLVSQQRTQAEMYMKQAQLQQQAREADANRGQQAVQFQLSREPSQRDYFQQSAAMDQATHHANLQMQLSSQQLSQQENMRLQRMRNAIGAVNADSTLSDEEKTQAITMLQSGIDPLERRRAAATQQHIKLQNQQLEQQAAHQDQLMENRRRYQTRSLQERLQTMVDPGSGEEHQFYMDEQGNPHPVFEGTMGRNRTAGNQGIGGTGQGNLATARIDVDRIRREAETQVRDELETQEKAAEAAATAAGRSYSRSSALTETQIQDRILQRAKARIAHERQLHAELNPQPEPGSAEGQAAALRQAQLEVNQMFPHEPQHVRRGMAATLHQERQAARTQATAPAQPFNPREPGTVAQQTIVRDFDQFRERARAAPGRTEEERQQIIHNIDRAERMRAAAGENINAMAPADRRIYESLMAALRNIPQPVAPRSGSRAGTFAGDWERFQSGLGRIGDSLGQATTNSFGGGI